VKPPDTDPPAATQAWERITLGLEGLEKKQDVSVGRKPEPLIPICKPTFALPELNLMTGEDSIFVRTITAANAHRRPINSNVRTNLK
jgi:hypothetical protein